jgi:hypothetical protein
MNTSKEIYFQRFNVGNVKESSPKIKRKSRHKDLGNILKSFQLRLQCVYNIILIENIHSDANVDILEEHLKGKLVL